ncbi:unnamed protein product, partial [Scytosiphon promiscuus]
WATDRFYSEEHGLSKNMTTKKNSSAHRRAENRPRMCVCAFRSPRIRDSKLSFRLLPTSRPRLAPRCRYRHASAPNPDHPSTPTPLPPTHLSPSHVPGVPSPQTTPP